MKILVISQYYYPEPFRVSEICEGLVSKGHTVDVLTGLPNYPTGKIYPGYEKKEYQENIKNVTVYRTKNRPRKTGKMNLFLNYFSFWHRSKKMIKKMKTKYDCIFVWEISPIFYLAAGNWYKKNSNIKMICYCMDVWPESLLVGGIKKKSFIYKIFLMLSKKMYGYCDEILISSPSFENYFRNTLNYQKDISFIPQHYTPSTIVSRRVQDSSKKEIFIYAGNLGKAQKIDNLISAFGLIENVEFHIYGNGSEYLKCFNLAKSFCNIKFFGLVDKDCLAEAFSNAKYCVLPLSSDSFIGNTIPGKLQEYLYYGKPILGAIAGDAAEIIAYLNCGELCDLNNSVSIKNAIIKLINIKDYNDISSREKEYYKNNFTLEAYIEKIIKVMEAK